MMASKQSLRLYSKEFIKTDLCHSKRLGGLKKNPDYVCDFLVYEPRNVEEARLGSLFILGKIENIPKNKYKNLDLLLNLLISVIKREFYSNYKRTTLEALETSLNKANLYLADFIEKGHTEWIGNLHFICGAFSQNALHITQAGEPIIKLFRGATISHIENKFPAQKKSHPLKTFTNIASGTIIDGDKIILATKDILKISSLKNLKELAKGSYGQIIEGLKKISENKADKTPILCLVLEAKMGAPEELAACLPLLTKNELKFSKDKTANIALFGIRKIFSFLIFIIKHIYKLLLLILVAIGRVFGKIPEPRLHKLIHKIKNFSLILIEHNKIKCFNLKTKFFKKYKIIFIYRNNKPAVFVASLLLCLILTLPFLIAREINHQIKIKNFNELSTEIQEIQKRTDAALVYSEKEKAKGLLQKNQLLLAGLLDYFQKSPFQKNKKFISIASELQRQYQNQQDSISNVKRIKNIEEVLDFSKSGFIVNPVGIEKLKEALYFYEFESGILYKSAFGEDADKNGLTLIFISAKDELRKMVALENGQIVLFGQSGKAYLYDSSTNDHKAYLLEPVITIEKIKGLESFSSNFYILDAGQGNIIRYALDQKENIIKGNNWLSEPVDELKEAISMATDGSIYVLKTEGLIIKYFRGEKVETIKPLLETPLAGDNKIFTGNDFKNLYISDPKNKRLIVLNKKGEVINQYINDEFANLIDFLVTEDEKEVYLLCGKKVFKFGL